MESSFVQWPLLFPECFNLNSRECLFAILIIRWFCLFWYVRVCGAALNRIGVILER